MHLEGNGMKSLFYENTVNLFNRLNDSELIEGMKECGLADEFLANLNKDLDKRFITPREAFDKRPEDARNFGRLMLVTLAMMTKGTRKYMHMSYRTLKFFSGATKNTPITRLVYRKRMQYQI